MFQKLNNIPIHKMKLIVLSTTLLIWNYVSCQDIVFPADKATHQFSGNNSTIKERLPIPASECPENMFLYPGDGNKSTWICDCRPKYLYFPSNNSCHEAYRQGPCPKWNYIILPLNESIPKCVENPCIKDGLVPYNGTCYSLYTEIAPCAPNGILGVNETTFVLECIPNDIVPFHIIGDHHACPRGSRRCIYGRCRPEL